MVFPAKKQPDQVLDSSYRWPKPAVDGEHMTFVWADYYTKLTNAFEQAIKSTAGPFFTAAATDLLASVSQESMVHMFCDYIRSAERVSGSLPTVKTPEATVYMLIDYIESLGWGKMHLQSLTPGEELVVEVKSEGSAADANTLCHMMAGAAAAIMDAVFGSGKTPDDKILSFKVTETRCRKRGESACRFEVKRNYNRGTTQCIPMQQPKS